MCAPIIYGGEVIGMVHADNMNTLRAFDSWELRLLGIICNQAALVLNNARLFKEKLAVIEDLKKANEKILLWNFKLDGTVQKRTEELRKKNEEVLSLSKQKDKLLGMAAHDLRNPLTAIMGYLELMRTSLSSDINREELKADLEKTSNVARHMHALLNDLLDVSKIEAGKISLNLDLVDVEEIIQSNARLHKRIAEQKGITLDASFPESIEKMWLDPLRISQVLNNLISNAIKFSQKGDSITITAKKAGNYLEVSVADTGQGISPGEMDCLFQAFQQTSTKATGGEAGIGLGLAIAKKVVELHGGKIRVDSTKGIGSKFSFVIPLN
jgi:signal transduction histidine kinase